MRTRNTIHFLGVLETIHNPNFNRIEFDAFIAESGTNAFRMSPSKWIEKIGASIFKIALETTAKELYPEKF